MNPDKSLDELLQGRSQRRSSNGTSGRSAQGLKMADLLVMPPAHQSMANWLMRRYEASLEEIADHVDQDPGTVQVTLDALIKRGLLKAVDSPQGLTYRVNLAPKSGRQMPKDIYKVLNEATEQANVFVSYSRRNKPFVERLYTSLRATNREVWVDWENIPVAVDWWQEIQLGIELADTFIFVLSPDSVQSQVCRQEIDYAVEHNKRLVPVVFQDVQPDQVHPELARLNWIFLRPEDTFDDGFQKLLTALDQNIDYVRDHTRILLRALEWDRHQRDSSYLLRGRDLHRANDYLVQGRKEEPNPTPLHHQYVLASAEAEAAVQKAEMARQSSTLMMQTQWLRLVSAISILAIALGLSSWGLYRQTMRAQLQAERAYIEALSRSAEALFLSDQRFEALITATQAGQLLQVQANGDNSGLQATVTSALRQALFWVHQRNRFDGHSGAIWRVEFDQSGEQILSVSADGTLRLWQADGTLMQSIASPVAALQDAALSPAGDWIVAVDRTGHGYLWNREGVLAQRWVMPGGQPAQVVRFSPDGAAIATGGIDGQIHLWHGETAAPLQTLGEHRGRLKTLVFSEDGTTLWTGDDQGWISQWSMDGTRQGEIQGHTGPVLDLALAGNTLAAASGDGEVSLWAMDTGGDFLQSLAQFPGHEGAVNSVQFTADGQQVITGGTDKALRLWNLAGQLQTTLRGHAGQVLTVASHPRLPALVSGGGDRALHLWYLERPHITPLAAHQAAVYSTAISPDGDTIATVSQDQTLRLWDQGGTLVQTIAAFPAPVRGVAFHPNSQQLVTADDQGTLTLWSQDGRQLRAWAGAPAAIHQVSFSPDGNLIAAASPNQGLFLWTLQGNAVNTIGTPSDGITGVAFSPDGRLIATAGQNQQVQIWQGQDGSLLQTLAGHQGGVFDVQFSPDGSQLVSASGDNTVRLWDVTSGNLITALDGHQDAVRSVTFSADGQGVVTASADNTLRFWHLDGTLHSTLSGHEQGLNDVAVDPLGRYVVSTSNDGTALIWQLDNMDTLDALLASSCNWLRDYLQTNQSIPESVQTMCTDPGAAATKIGERDG